MTGRGGRLEADGAYDGVEFLFVNLRGANLRGVSFDGCALGEVDVGMAELRGVRFTDCRIDRLELSGAKLDDVDLSHSSIQRIDGIGSPAGATMSGEQLMALSAVFGRHLGIRLREPGDTG